MINQNENYLLNSLGGERTFSFDVRSVLSDKKYNHIW